ncbi:unnamed protein product [Bursaphelenchus xylophilus]|uniref:(pine wood nematode) hypothetical protein n=1 Tax=Bursaphelenchus xylophilus TaxID=6326 RepID=A0A1I7RVA4_BURXY|nr:unnamed protein product [Bursaphelenchus xylophilus]CAG9086604.1 unnamed protein product [Bursaphelenchus xylophilus]
MVFGLKSKDRKTNDLESSKYNKRVFGVSLSIAVRNGAVSSSVHVPRIVWECVSHVNQHGLLVEGIYRISASKARLDELEKLADSGSPIQFTDAHNAAGLLKRFLRQLPSHVLGDIRKGAEETASSCQCNFDSPCRCDAVVQVSKLLKELPIENYHLLCIVFIHAQFVVQNSNVNKMNFAALGVLLQAMLNMPKQLIRLFLLNASSRFCGEGETIKELFGDSVITR